MGVYDESSLLMQVREKIGSKLTISIDPKNELNLEQMLQKLKARFNSSERLEEEVSRLKNFKLNGKWGKAESIQEYLDLRQLINSRYEQLGREYMRWSMTRLIDHLIKHILSPEQEFTREFSRRWTQLDEEAKEKITVERIRAMVAAVEDHAALWDEKSLSTNQVQINALGTTRSYGNVGGRKLLCWRCGDYHVKEPGRYFMCPSNKTPVCEECRGPHLTRFHGEASVRRTMANTQGGVVNMNKGGTASPPDESS